jgi:cytochrome c553
MAAKGCHGRGGNANGKRYEAKAHDNDKEGARRVRKVHETAERRHAKEAIQEGLNDVE